MFSEMSKRPYRLKARARRQEETRARIVDAAMALHEELGPRETPISAIAARAGVQRLTVYRHFPDAEALFRACSSSWLALHPPPDPGTWQDVADPLERSRRALRALYGYYRSTERMWDVAYRDVGQVPALEAPMAQFEAYLDQLRRELGTAWSRNGRPGKALAAALGLLLHFRGWQIMSAQGSGDATIADAAARWLEALGTAGRPASGPRNRRT